MMHKMMIATCALFAPLLLMHAESMLSVLEATDTVENLLSVGQNDIQIIEDFDPHPDNVGYVKKEVRVKNVNTVDVFVRVLVLPNQSASVKDWNFDNTYWSQGTDGYWYYAEPLAFEEESVPVLYGLYALKEMNNFEVYVYAESVESYGAKTALDAFKTYSWEGTTYEKD